MSKHWVPAAVLLQRMMEVVEVGIAQPGEDGMEGKEKIRDWGETEGLHPVVKALKDTKGFWESDYSIQSNELKLPM